MSALPPKPDMDQHDRDVRFVPKADIVLPPFDQLYDRPPGLSTRTHSATEAPG
jgi:hypothetical protein